MQKAQVIDKKGKVKSEVTLPKEVFSCPVNSHLLYEAAVNTQANQRRGTASTKTRGEVRGSNRKPWRQKGTGRARAGSIRSPLWRKGGTTFGPKPRDYAYVLPRKIKRNALKSVLSLKFSENQMLICDDLTFQEPKTKMGVELLRSLHVNSALIVDSHKNMNLFLSLRNLPKVKVVDWAQVNVYDVLRHKWLVFSESAFQSLMEKLK
ncbi:MAG: 50S ribosomal protein L4 [Candidatus Aminicenantales bacterium]